MDNADIAETLGELADLLELTGGNAFKVRAYRQAAQTLLNLPEPISQLWRAGTLTELPAVGEGIAAKVGELLETGTLAERERLVRSVPPGLLDLMRLEGVGPKTVATVWHGLGVTDLDALDAAARDGRLAALPRLGVLRAKHIREAIERHRKRGGRLPVNLAYAHAEALLERLRRVPGVLRAEACGSLRRRKETVGDLDLLVAAADPAPVLRAFLALPGVTATVAEGPTRSAVRLRDGLQVDLRVVPRESFGAALHYFTGSQAHNIALRTRAVRLGLKLNEYGVFDREGHRLGGAEEQDVFRAVNLPFIPPELRENAGEIEAAEAGRLPRLVEEADLLGDLHVHSDASSDGRSGVDELVDAARALGRRYLAITDHSRSRPLGLDAPALLAHAAALRARNREGEAPRLLAGIEVDIRSDGSLDLPVPVLASLDWVVASIHSRLRDPREVITARMIRAIRSGVVDVVGHPSGRIIGARDPSDFDLERVLEEAAREGVSLEVNAQPDRLDLTDRACRLAAAAGATLVINSDAHMAPHLGNLRHGVWVARRGWLEARHVLNTRDAEALRERRLERLRRTGATEQPAAQP